MKHNPSEAELNRFGDFVGKCLAMLAFTNNEEIQEVEDKEEERRG